jgi:hypothetical protein
MQNRSHHSHGGRKNYRIKKAPIGAQEYYFILLFRFKRIG